MKPKATPNLLQQAPAPPAPAKKGLPAAPPRRRVSEKASLGEQSAGEVDRGMMAERDQLGPSRVSLLSLPPQGNSDSPGDKPQRTTEQGQEAVAKASDLGNPPELPKKIRQPPVPPPRKKRISRQLASILPSPLESAELSAEEVAPEKSASGPPRESQSPTSQAGTQSPHAKASDASQSTPEFKGSLASLSDSGGVPASGTDQDSYSTSSTEEELEQFSSPSVKKSSMILGKARHRLSLVSFSSVFQAFLSNDRKLYKRVVELAQDKASYFGNLVQDYKVYSLEMMARQASSTEMLQEIRTMMTQLKSYLLQSTELKALVEPVLHSEEGLGQSWGGGVIPARGRGQSQARAGSGWVGGVILGKPPFPQTNPTNSFAVLPRASKFCPCAQLDGGKTSTRISGWVGRHPQDAPAFMGRQVTRSNLRHKKY